MNQIESIKNVDQLRITLGASFNDILPNVDRILRKSNVLNEWSFYEEIMADDMVYTCVNKIVRAVTGYKWEIYQGEAKDEVYDAVRSAFLSLSINGNIKNTIQNIVKTICYGRQFLVVEWGFSGKYQLPSQIFNYPLELFKYNIDGQILMRQGNDIMDYVPVPVYTVLNPRYNPTLKNPYGESLVSRCYWLVFFKKNALQFFNVFLEKYGMPWVISQYDSGILSQLYPNDSAEVAAGKIVYLLKNQTQDAVLVLPKEIDTNLTSPSSAQNTDNYKLLLDYCNEGISRIFTGHTATTIATPGKLGTDKSSNDEYERVIAEQKESVVEVFNNLIRWIIEVNFNDAVAPEFRFYVEEDINQELAARDAILVDKLGVRFKKPYLSREYNIPEDEFDVVDPQSFQPAQMTSDIRIESIVEKLRKGEFKNNTELLLAVDDKFKDANSKEKENLLLKIIHLASK